MLTLIKAFTRHLEILSGLLALKMCSHSPIDRRPLEFIYNHSLTSDKCKKLGVNRKLSSLYLGCLPG